MVRIFNGEGTKSCGKGDDKLPILTAKVPTGKGKGKGGAATQGKVARQPPVRKPSSDLTASPKRPEEPKQALEKPRPAPTR